MKLLKIFIAIITSIGWFYIMEISWKIGDNYLPPVGKFFHPHVGFWNNVRMVSSPKLDLKLVNAEYDGDVYFTDRLVPHIVADDLANAYFLQGYVHARMRLWQMDFATRAAEGRLSEIVGKAAVEFDKLKRRKGLAESAKVSDSLWKKDTQNYALVEAYAAGVNFYIDRLRYKDLPIEFKLMNYWPEKWRPYRSSLFHKSMAEILCGRDYDIELTNAKMFFGKDFDLLFPELDSLTDPVVSGVKEWGFKLENGKALPQTAEADSTYYPIDQEEADRGLGSNNWAIGPRKSATANPILCNDPHLTLTLPCIWFEQQIMTRDMNVYGVTFPGIPSVVIGFNKDIAWGVTNAGWDMVDWYSVQWKDDRKLLYKKGTHWVKAKLRIEEIKVRYGDSVIDTVRITDWGPVVYTESPSPKAGLAMRWIIHEPSESFELNVFKELNRAKTFDDYRSAISSFPYPAQNFAFASKNGDIAMTVQGKMPIKRSQQGRFVERASDSAAYWNTYLPAKWNPHCKNPSRGFVSSANQRSTDLTFPVYYNDGDFRDYRGAIINQKLRSKEKWTVEEMKAMQSDVFSLKASMALPFFLSHLSENQCSNPLAKSVIDKLQDWDYRYTAESKSPSYFQVWMSSFYNLCWDEITQDTQYRHVALPGQPRTIDLMKKQPHSKYFDLQSTDKKESAYDIIQLAFDSVMAYALNPVTGNKTWAEQKNAVISHMARIPAFSVSKLKAAGTEDVINAHTSTFGPSWRMVVELTKDGPHAFGVFPGGQHGHPGHPHYKDMIDAWLKGRHYPLFFAHDVDTLLKSAIFKISFKK